MDRRLRRPASGARRCRRLDRAHPVLGNAQLRPARPQEPPRLSPSFGRPEHERRRPASDRARTLIARNPLALLAFVSSSGQPDDMTDGYAEFFISSSDGLRLFARDYGPRGGSALPVVCLPGLARNPADFHALALALSRDERRPRRVLAVDYRGRGRSEHDPDWRRYDVRVELDDVLQVLAAAGIAHAVFVGTSRGGIIAMGISAARPALLRGAVLNDIGPVIEGTGLVRIRGYVGKLPQPADQAQAIEILKNLMSA